MEKYSPEWVAEKQKEYGEWRREQERQGIYPPASVKMREMKKIFGEDYFYKEPEWTEERRRKYEEWRDHEEEIERWNREIIKFVVNIAVSAITAAIIVTLATR